VVQIIQVVPMSQSTLAMFILAVLFFFIGFAAGAAFRAGI
jgi:hypothetical protein